MHSRDSVSSPWFGDNLRAARTRARVTIVDLAASVGVPHMVLTAIERRLVAPEPEFAARIAEALGVDVSVLVPDSALAAA